MGPESFSQILHTESSRSKSPVRFTPEESDATSSSTDSQHPHQVNSQTESVRHGNPTELIPEESDVASPSSSPELQGPITQVPVLLIYVDANEQHIPDEASKLRTDPGGQPTPSAFQSFQKRYLSHQEVFPEGYEEYVETVYLSSSFTRSLSSPYELRIMEDLIISAHDFNSISITQNIRERSDSFIHLIWQARSFLTHGQYDNALHRHKQAAEMVPDPVQHTRPSLLIDIVHFATSGASSLCHPLHRPSNPDPDPKS